MSKHVNFAICPSCEEKLKDAHTDIADWFREVVKPVYMDAHISWSYRGEKEQSEAVEQGKSKLKFPKSPHNQTDKEGSPCARALDLFQLVPAGLAIWDHKYFQAIKDLSKFSTIKWGGDFKDLGDADHFELT